MMEGESDDPEGSASFDQHSANCELGHCGRIAFILFVFEGIILSIRYLISSSHPTVSIH
jgi:hypothetical protein